MASSPEFIEYVCAQLSLAGTIQARKMFGDYGIYCDGKIIGVVCDNQLFLKPTKAGRALLETPVEAPPYPGAKPSFLIETLDDPEALARLVRAGWEELPVKKAKKK